MLHALAYDFSNEVFRNGFCVGIAFCVIVNFVASLFRKSE
jgi:hypothetical protein